MSSKRKDKTIKTRVQQKVMISFLMISIVYLLVGCGNQETKIVLTTGFAKDEVFRIDKSSCTVPEIMVYLTNVQNQYENVFGEEIWQTDLAGSNLESSVKDTVLARMAQVKTMNLLANQHGIQLNEEEKKLVLEATQKYYDSLNETEIKEMGIDKDTIQVLYTEYALANKVYHDIIKDINPEISDDEARTITVEQIWVKTYSLNADGSKLPFDETKKTQAFQKASAALALARGGANFENLIEQYNEGPKSTISFGIGEVDTALETASFNLGTDEISDIVETEDGYYIVKCISTFDREETDANKIKIVEERKKEVFNQEYDVFVSGLTKNLNKELWDRIVLIQKEDVNTNSFFDIYTELFGNS